MRVDWMLYGLAAAAALVALGQLMHQRQSTLKELLRQHVDRQLQWRKKRDKAAQIAQRAVQDAVESEQAEVEAAMTEAATTEATSVETTAAHRANDALAASAAHQSTP